MDNAGFELRPGEIHALLGENGAGKSTLMHVMSGYLQPDSGSIIVDGIPRHFSLPRDAIKTGIGMVRQDPRMVPGFRVWEDCIVGLGQNAGILESRSGIIFRTKSRELVKSVSDEWGFDLPIDDSVENLTIGQRQKTAILSLLLKNVTYFILDEPTAVLSILETERLFYLLKKLRDDGKGIVIISHKLEETLALSDCVTVLRNGKLTASRESKNVSMEKISSYIFGSENIKDITSASSLDKNDKNIRKSDMQEIQTIFQVKNLSVEDPEKPFLRGIDINVTRGKITGFAGVRDSGLETLELVLSGFLVPKTGTIMLNGRSIGRQGPEHFRKAGGAYLSGDRTGTAMAYELPLFDSLIIHAHRRCSGNSIWQRKLGFLDKTYLHDWVDRIMEKAGISRSVESSGQAFSGGMIQRILVQRELAENADLFILSEPVWGLDRNAAEKVISELKEYAEKEKSILIFSTDLDFLISVSDEIIALQNGFISASFGVKDFSQTQELKEEIAHAMIGIPRYHNAGLPL